MSEENKQTEEQFTIEVMANKVADILSDMIKVQIRFKDGIATLSKIVKLKHTELAITNLLEHMSIDMNALRELAENAKKEVKKDG